MRSAALLEARRLGKPAFPVLRVAWASRALSLGTGIYSPTMRETAAGGVTAVTKPGGWGVIKYGSGINETGLKAVETSVSVADPKSELINMLETYDPRGSAAIIDWASPGLAVADWEPVFSGVVMDWARDNLHTKLILKTDDTLLRSPVPPGVYQRAEWGSASEATIYGTSMPLVMGVHDSWQVTQRGMVAATNIRYDKDQGYWWLASVDRMMEISRIYFDGVPQGTGGWSVLRGVYGSSYLTIIVLAPGFQPDKGVVVAYDCRAMDPNGLITGPIPLTGAPDQLRAILEEYTFRPAPLRGWRGHLTICESTSWDAVSAFFALHKIESAHKTGGDQAQETAAAVIDSFLAAYTWVRMWWTETGQIAISVIDPDEARDASAAGWLDIQKHHEGGQVPFLPGDRREVYSQVKMPFMWSSSEQKYLTAYEAHDVAALAAQLVLSTDNPWSQCRFGDPSGDLNPAPPDDPVLPECHTPSASDSASSSASVSPSSSSSPSPSVGDLDSGLQHYYRMEEATGNSARVDLQGNGDWTATGSPTQATGKNNFGVGVQAAKYLSMSTPTLLPATFTLGFWLNANSYLEVFANPVPVIVSDNGSTGFDFTRGDGFGGSDVVLRMYPGNGAASQGSNPLSTGSWHAVMIWATSTTFGFQIDGGSDHTGSTSFARGSGTMYCSYIASTGVNGTMDEMEVWNRVLSAAERAVWYNAGSGQFR